jgi:hypothetical protein
MLTFKSAVELVCHGHHFVFKGSFEARLISAEISFCLKHFVSFLPPVLEAYYSMIDSGMKYGSS